MVPDGTPLDPTNPQSINVAEETLNIWHSDFSSEENTTHVSILTPDNSNISHNISSLSSGCSPTGDTVWYPLPNSVDCLSSESFLAPIFHPPMGDYLGELLRTL